MQQHSPVSSSASRPSKGAHVTAVYLASSTRAAPTTARPETTVLPDDFDAQTAPTASFWGGARRATTVLPDDFDVGTVPTTSMWVGEGDGGVSEYIPMTEGAWIGGDNRRRSTTRRGHRAAKTTVQDAGDEGQTVEEYTYHGEFDPANWGSQAWDMEEVRKGMMHGGVVELEREARSVAEASTGMGVDSRRGPSGRSKRSTRDRNRTGDATQGFMGFQGSGEHTLVEKRVLEDGPERTVSLWRTESANSYAKERARGRGVTPSETDSHPNRQALHGVRRDKRSERVREHAAPPSSFDFSRTRETRAAAASYPTPPTSRATSGAHRGSGASKASTSNQAQQGSLRRRPGRDDLHASRHHRQESDGRREDIEELLATNEPPLTHLTHILGALGVRTEAHLRALGLMREEVRDREVRREAIRRGVTVVEWAMLVDLMERL